MANYDDPFYRGQRIDPGKVHDHYNPDYEGGSGTGILIALLVLFLLLGGGFALFGGGQVEDGTATETAPATAPAQDAPLAADPAAPEATGQ